MDATEERLEEITARQRQLEQTRKYVSETLRTAEEQARHAKSNIRSIDEEHGKLTVEKIRLLGYNV
jgi:outer membrane murein-binding lipoprotein Lpp